MYAHAVLCIQYWYGRHGSIYGGAISSLCSEIAFLSVGKWEFLAQATQCMMILFNVIDWGKKGMLYYIYVYNNSFFPYLIWNRGVRNDAWLLAPESPNSVYYFPLIFSTTVSIFDRIFPWCEWIALVTFPSFLQITKADKVGKGSKEEEKDTEEKIYRRKLAFFLNLLQTTVPTRTNTANNQVKRHVWYFCTQFKYLCF